MPDKPLLDCAACVHKHCREGRDCFGRSGHDKQAYRDRSVRNLHRAASAIEARHYCREARLGEIILFAEEMGFSRVGLAFCVGLADEAAAIADILAKHFEVASVCCKVGGIMKSDLDLEQIHGGKQAEVTCNPAGQAEMLNEWGSELNVLCGLCVGHDALFSMQSKAPVTTLIAKDRVLAHNPAGAVYCRYIRRNY
jgi:uncharacterized metal-binding protein